MPLTEMKIRDNNIDKKKYEETDKKKNKSEYEFYYDKVALEEFYSEQKYQKE